MYTTQVREHGMLPSTGTVGDSYDNAMAESVNGAYKTELEDTGTDRNRVSCKPSGTNRLTIKGNRNQATSGSLIALVMLRCDGLDIHLPQPRT